MASAGKMAGKKVVVTGAGTGIGRGMALEMARQGADVVLHYSRSAGGAVSAVDEITKAGGKATAFQADFREIDPVKELAAKALDFLGGCDVLVNNAGITNNVSFEELEPKHFDTPVNVNLRAQFFLTQALLPALVDAAPSSVINLTSVHAFSAQTEHTVYAATTSIGTKRRRRFPQAFAAIRRTSRSWRCFSLQTNRGTFSVRHLWPTEDSCRSCRSAVTFASGAR